MQASRSGGSALVVKPQNQLDKKSARRFTDQIFVLVHRSPSSERVCGITSAQAAKLMRLELEGACKEGAHEAEA